MKKIIALSCQRNNHTSRLIWKLKLNLYCSIILMCLILIINEAKADILNGSFTNSSQNWITQQNFFCTNSGFTSYNSSPGYAWFARSDGQPSNNIWGTLTQSFTMPSLYSSASLDFYTKITTDEIVSKIYDFMNCSSKWH